MLASRWAGAWPLAKKRECYTGDELCNQILAAVGMRTVVEEPGHGDGGVLGDQAKGASLVADAIMVPRRDEYYQAGISIHDSSVNTMSVPKQRACRRGEYRQKEAWMSCGMYWQ